MSPFSRRYRRRGTCTPEPVPASVSATLAWTEEAVVAKASRFSFMHNQLARVTQALHIHTGGRKKLEGQHALQSSTASTPQDEATMGGAMNVNLPLVTLNSDVLMHIMSWLPPSSLTALMATCRFFSEFALQPLCAYTRKPLRTLRQFRSFYAFLRVGSSSPRTPLIRELRIVAIAWGRRPWEEDEECGVVSDAENTRRASDTILSILPLCQNLRRLYLDHQFDRSDLQSVTQALVVMNSLEELSLRNVEMVTEQDFRILARPHLRTLQIEASHDLFTVPNVLEIIYGLSDTLSELDLRSVHQWTTTPRHAFPHVRRLTIGYPKDGRFDALASTFPSLKHLTLNKWDQTTTDIHDQLLTHALRLREFHRQHWRSHPEQWPALVSLSGAEDDPYTMYALAIPQHVPCVSLPYCLRMEEPRLLPIYRSILDDTRPSCVELRIQLPGEALAYKQFDILRSLGAVRRCIVTIQVSNRKRPRREQLNLHQEAMLNALRHALKPLSLTHLMIKFSESESSPSDPYTRLWKWRLKTDATENFGSLADASPTLRWVGLYVEPDILRGWGVVRSPGGSPSNSAGTTPYNLEAMSVDEACAVIADEGMEEFVRPDRHTAKL
ncbi:hypothetical protein FKP32DRAFT_1678107 [Trametes sanguinea]|nr:hypothetical protein FKP32DRAFT_1678107 [Trametes sanguinea]